MNSINDRYFVYAYFEPEAVKPFYIGKGCGNRHLIHLTRSVMDSDDSFFHKKLRKMLDSGILPIVRKLLENLSEQEALIKEKLFIRIYGRQDIGTGCLCNHTDGGDQPPNQTGFCHTQETKDRIGKASLGSLNIEMKIIKSQSPRSKEFRKRHSEILSEIRGQPVESYNLITDAVIKVYPTLTSTKVDGYDFRLVHRCANGKTKSHRNVGWRYTVIKKGGVV